MKALETKPKPPKSVGSGRKRTAIDSYRDSLLVYRKSLSSQFDGWFKMILILSQGDTERMKYLFWKCTYSELAYSLVGKELSGKNE